MTIPVPLTRRHYQRLRFYWQGRSRGAASLTDAIDLDLAGMGLICRRDRGHGAVYFSITPEGEVALAEEKQREIARRAPHHDMGARLAAFLRSQGRVTWEGIEFMVGDMNSATRQAVRPDVFSLVCTRNADRINPLVHEIKVSRADFLADVANPKKREGYARIADAVIYVAPAGMIAPDEVPAPCGLLVESEPGAFKIARRAKKQRVTLAVEHFMNLILKPGSLDPL